MSGEQASAVSKKTKKVIEQWADTQDAFVNKLYKKLRNGQKKLNDIQEVEKKIKTKEIQPTPELLEKVQRREKVKAEMDEVLGYLELYKESFPENPAFAGGAKKATKKPEAAPQQVVEPVVAEPAIDVSKVVEDALSLVADAVIFGQLNAETPLTGTNNNINDSLHFLSHAWSGLHHGVGSWSSAKGNFVDTFSRLALKSSTQVGSHTSKSFSDIHAFLTNLAASEGSSLLAKTRSTDETHSHHHHDHHNHKHEHHHHGHKHENHHHDHKHEEEEKASSGNHTAEGEAVAETNTTAADGDNKNDHPHKDHNEGTEENKEGGEFRGNRRGRGGYRGNNYRKHNQDEEGFQVVKQDEAHHNHYNSRRQNRGGFRGGRGSNRGGEGGENTHRGGRGGHREEGGENTHRGGRGGHRGEGGENTHRGGRGGHRGDGGENTHRGSRGGHRGEGRPWTAKEHKNAGEVRKIDPHEHTAGEETGPKATTEAPTSSQ